MTAVGSLVPVGVVARWCGRHARTLKRWIRAGHVDGCIVGRRWYVTREDAEELREGRAPRGARTVVRGAQGPARPRRNVTA